MHIKSLFSLLLLTGVAACGGKAPEAARGGTAERPPRPVEVQAVELGVIRDELRLTAEVRAMESSRLSAGSGGLIEALLVDEGATVSKGQVLARVNADAAAAQLKQAEVALSTARSEHDRVKRLAERELASASTSEQSAMRLAQAEAAYELARVANRNAVLRAPHAGTIAKRYASAGEFAPPGAPIFDVVDTHAVKVIAQVAERDVPLLEEGRGATVHVDALPDESFTGTVRRIGAVADPYSRTFDLEIVVPNPGKRLRPGMLARVNVPRQVLEGVPVVRRDAVVEDVNGRTVFVTDNGVAQRLAVEIGPTDGERVAVVKGLKPGMQVVIAGQRSLVHGQRVQVVERAAAAPPVAPPVANAAQK